MAEAAFPFLRATFYRWMQVWPEACADLATLERWLDQAVTAVSASDALA